MGITAKEIAKIVGVTPASVSMALNGKPGVSTPMRKKIMQVAKDNGYDFKRISEKKNFQKIFLLIYSKNNIILNDDKFFVNLVTNIKTVCKKLKINLEIIHCRSIEDANKVFADFEQEYTNGVLLLATEMTEYEMKELKIGSTPLIVLDTVHNAVPCDFVLTNNEMGAFLATDYLLRQFHVAPGYLKSSYSIINFEQRSNGFYSAVRNVGLSASQCRVISLPPTVEGAYLEMKGILERKEPLARCYFADNDFIAIGVMKALREAGYSVPRDVALIGYDNIPDAQKYNLSTVNSHWEVIGEIGVKRLLMTISEQKSLQSTTLVNTSLILRGSSDLF